MSFLFLFIPDFFYSPFLAMDYKKDIFGSFAYELHSAVLSGRWCGDQRPLCGPAAGECQSVEFGFITTV